MFGDGGDSGAEFAIKDNDKQAEEAIGGWAHAIFVPIPFQNFRSIRVKVAAELVASETEVVAEKAELFAVEPDGTVGEGLAMA